MKDDTRDLLYEVLEGLIGFVAAVKPDQRDRDKALLSLIAFRDHLESCD